MKRFLVVFVALLATAFVVLPGTAQARPVDDNDQPIACWIGRCLAAITVVPTVAVVSSTPTPTAQPSPTVTQIAPTGTATGQRSEEQASVDYAPKAPKETSTPLPMPTATATVPSATDTPVPVPTSTYTATSLPTVTFTNTATPTATWTPTLPPWPTATAIPTGTATMVVPTVEPVVFAVTDVQPLMLQPGGQMQIHGTNMDSAFAYPDTMKVLLRRADGTYLELAGVEPRHHLYEWTTTSIVVTLSSYLGEESGNIVVRINNTEVIWPETFVVSRQATPTVSPTPTATSLPNPTATPTATATPDVHVGAGYAGNMNWVRGEYRTIAVGVSVQNGISVFDWVTTEFIYSTCDINGVPAIRRDYYAGTYDNIYLPIEVGMSASYGPCQINGRIKFDEWGQSFYFFTELIVVPSPTATSTATSTATATATATHTPTATPNTRPVITSVSVTNVHPGDWVVIHGRNFLRPGVPVSQLQVWLAHDNGGVYWWGINSNTGKPISPDFWDQDSIQFQIPTDAPAQSGVLYVIVGNMFARYDQRFSISPHSTPTATATSVPTRTATASPTPIQTAGCAYGPTSDLSFLGGSRNEWRPTTVYYGFEFTRSLGTATLIAPSYSVGVVMVETTPGQARRLVPGEQAHTNHAWFVCGPDWAPPPMPPNR